MRDFEDELREVRRILESIDAPAPQVTITCHMIRAETDATGGDLPADLVQGLSELLPGRSFRSHAYAMLRAGVAPGHVLSLRLEDDHGDYVLTFEPVAFDSQSGMLAVAGCTLTRNGLPLFSTDTTFKGGEHTVIGATGTQPTFLVVHVAVP